MIKDYLVFQSLLRQFSSQELIQFGRSEVYIILDPEYIDKWLAKIISSAAKNDGIVLKEQLIKNWSLNLE